MPDVEKGTSLSRSQFLNLTYLTGLALFLEACGINTETPTLTPQQKKLNKIDFNSPSPDTKNVQDDIFSIYPELKQLEQIQKEIITIGPTDIEIINLSRTYVNPKPIGEIYNYVYDVARQFEDNGWYYPGVKYVFNGEIKQLDIFARRTNPEKQSLVLLPSDFEIPGLNMPNRIGATTHEPYEITFLRIPNTANYYPGLTDAVPTYSDEISNIHLIATEACQSSVWVSSPQDTIPRSFTAHEIFCNSLGWHIALSQSGLSYVQAKKLTANLNMDVGFIYNPMPPDPNLYLQIPKIENLFQK